jgi:hypothetical protein
MPANIFYVAYDSTSQFFFPTQQQNGGQRELTRSVLHVKLWYKQQTIFNSSKKPL